MFKSKGNRLQKGSQIIRMSGSKRILETNTYGAKGNRGCRQPDKSPISSMRLVDRIGIFIAELFKYVVYPLVVLGSDEFSYDPLKPVHHNIRIDGYLPSTRWGPKNRGKK